MYETNQEMEKFSVESNLHVMHVSVSTNKVEELIWRESSNMC